MRVSQILKAKSQGGVITISPQASVSDAAGLLSERFRHMPVVKDGAMIGLITIGDVVKSRLTELAMEKDALEGMIMGH